MLNFKTDYVVAMSDQAPRMLTELRKTGALKAHLEKKAEEARLLFVQLTAGKPTLPGSGVLENPQDEAEAREIVYATLIEFPPTESETTSEAEAIPRF